MKWVWPHKWMSLFLSLCISECVCVCHCLYANVSPMKTIQHLFSIVSVNFSSSIAFERYCMWTLWVHSPRWLPAESIIKRRNNAKKKSIIFLSILDRKMNKRWTAAFFSRRWKTLIFVFAWVAQLTLYVYFMWSDEYHGANALISIFLSLAIFHTLSLLSELDKYLCTAVSWWFMID